MAVVTWTGSTDTDYGTAGNWDTGSVPTSSDDVVIADVTNNCVLDGTRSVNSFTVLSGGDFNGNTEMLTVVGEADGSGATSNGFAVNIDGVIVGTNTNITVATPTATTVDFYAQGGGKVRHVTINHASCVATLGALLDISGNLTITAGELNTNSGSNYAVTVEGITTIGDGTGGTPDEATLTCNGSTCSFGSGVTADFGLKVRANGTFVGGSGTHTAGGFNMDQNASAKATMTSGVMTINSEKTSANKAWRVEFGGDTFDNNNGTVKFQLNGFDSRMSMRSEGHANNAFHNLIIDGDGDTRQISPDNGNKIKVDNDLTITRGKLVMGINHELEVGGDVVIDDASDTAELEMGSSSNISPKAATFGSLTIGNTGTYKATSGTTTVSKEADTGGTDFMFHNDGTFTHNDGKFVFDDAGLSSSSNVRNSSSFHDVELTMGSFSLTSHHNMTATGTFTVTTGTYSDGSNGFHIDELVTVKNGATLNLSNSTTQTKTLGALLVESGGTFRACRNITQFDAAGQGHSGNPSAIEIQSGGTFNHNNGTIKLNGITDQDIEMDGTGNFYNLTLDKTNNDVIMHPNVTIENNLDVTLASDHTLRPASTSNTVTVLNQTILRAGQIGATTAYDANHNWGTLTILGGTFIVGSGTNEVTAIRNVGGTIS
tara:strand:- start:195 stop:2168 length:1974 start_codon:yes stop_codon:yes gene_type:complete